MVRLQAERLVDPLPDGGGSALDQWRVRCRSRLVDLLGPTPAPVPLALETLESEQCDGYRRHKIVFDTEETMSVPAYLLVPDGRAAPGPAVLAAHGHGPGKDLVCGLAETPAPNGDYAVQLVRRGYVVLAPDLRCFGERADWTPPDHYICDTNLVHAVMAGENPLAQNLWDLARCLDVLETHPLVDPARMGMVGLSYGGTVTLFLAALDERVAACVVSGYFSSWAEAHKMPWNMCGSQVLTGMLGQTRTRGPRGPDRAPADAHRERYRRRPVPHGGGHRRLRATAPGLRRSRWRRRPHRPRRVRGRPPVARRRRLPVPGHMVGRGRNLPA